MTTATTSETFSNAELTQVHSLVWAYSSVFHGERYDAMWASLTDEEKKQIRDKSRWEGETTSHIVHDYRPELFQGCAVVSLYQPREGGDDLYIVGYVDADGNTLMRTERDWQREYHAGAKLDPDAYLVQDDYSHESFITLREAFDRAS